MKWIAAKSPVDGYEIYRGLTSGGPYTRLNASVVRGTSFRDSSVVAGETYYYVITSIAQGIESGFSNESVAAIPSP